MSDLTRTIQILHQLPTSFLKVTIIHLGNNTPFQTFFCLKHHDRTTFLHSIPHPNQQTSLIISQIPSISNLSSKMTNPNVPKLPPDHLRCITIGWKWRCKRYKFRNSKFCRKHYASYRGKIDGLTRKNRLILYSTDFREEQEVEVLRKDEILKLKGWFKARILKLPPNSRSKSKKNKEILVKFDREDLGVESVDFSLVRPLPSPLALPLPLPLALPPPLLPTVQEMESFDLNQRIEVFCNGGWWKGEIFEVLENGRYIVGCANWGEKREVGVDELRICQEWVDDEWVVPLLKEDLEYLNGQSELILANNIINYFNWLPFGSDAGTDGVSNELDQKRKAPMLRSRGRPRKKMHKEDSGVVSLSGQREDVGECSISEDLNRTETIRITECCTATMETDLTQMGTDGIANESDQRKRKPPSRPRGRPQKNLQKEDTPVREEGTNLHDSTSIASSSRLLVHQTTSTSQKISTCVSSSNILEWPWHGNGLETLSSIEDAPRLSPTPQDQEMLSYIQVATEPRCAIAPAEASMDVTVQVEGSLHQLDARQDAIDIFTNLPSSLSDGVEGDSSSSQVQLLQMSTKINGDENNQQKQATEDQRNDVHEPASPQGCTSFTKTFPMWEILESMEIFKSMPQRPHFRPLTEENEYIREGRAIGYMISFLAAVEITEKLKFDEYSGTIVETLNALQDLEAHGFDVRLVRGRLEKLRAIKTRVLEYDVERKQVEAEILNRKLEEKHLEHNIAILTEKKRELQKSRANLMKKKEIVEMKKKDVDSKFTTLQRNIQETMDEIQKINLQFAALAAKPW